MMLREQELDTYAHTQYLSHTLSSKSILHISIIAKPFLKQKCYLQNNILHISIIFTTISKTEMLSSKQYLKHKEYLHNNILH